ncbi:MAG: prepilin-type N-terminal cleavage/methylation domain-containing protein [Phycisphaerales bacterium]|nr:prepilin-type N-terminal cleavage/methylation domain-containing protein [Phycisphaerales bacterium]
MTRPPRPRRGFTIVELLIAGVIAAMVFSVLAVSMTQIVQAKNISKERLDAHLRANVALKNLRRDLISTLRRDDLFFTRLVLEDQTTDTPQGELDRDEILLFNHRLRASREIDYNGEGVEYETAYRIDEDDWGPVLWQRRDSMPDQYPTAGGITTPIAEGVVGLRIEAWDGDQWEENWDSDYDGLPHALRITVTASGHLPGQPVYDSPLAHLRTIVPLERTPPPDDVMEYRLQEQLALLNGEEGSGDGLGNGLSAGEQPDSEVEMTGSGGGGSSSGRSRESTRNSDDPTNLERE